MQPDIDSILASILGKEKGEAIKAGIQNSESRIQNPEPESGIRKPESSTIRENYNNSICFASVPPLVSDLSGG